MGCVRPHAPSRCRHGGGSAMKRQHIGAAFWFKGARFVVASARQTAVWFLQHGRREEELQLIRVVADLPTDTRLPIKATTQPDYIHLQQREWPSDEQLSKALGFE